MLLSALESVSSLRIYVPTDLRSVDERESVVGAIKQVKKRFPENLPLLDPVKDMGIQDEHFTRLVEKISILKSRLESLAAHATYLPVYESKLALMDKLKTLKQHIKEATSIIQMDELKYRKRVLRRYHVISCCARVFMFMIASFL